MWTKSLWQTLVVFSSLSLLSACKSNQLSQVVSPKAEEQSESSTVVLAGNVPLPASNQAPQAMALLGTDGGVIANPGGDQGSGPDHGVIASPARLTISPDVYDFRVQSIRSFVYKTFTVTNTGGQSALALSVSGLAAPYSFKGGSYPGTGGTCGLTLGGNASCTLVLVFHPMAVGSFPQDSFRLNYNNGSVALRLLGTGTDIATLFLSNGVDDSSSYNYGDIPFSSSINHVFKVQFWGSRPATGVSFSGVSGPFSIIWNHCPTEISADCELAVRYTGSVQGMTQQKLKVTYDNSAFAAETSQLIRGTTSAQVTDAMLTIEDKNFGRQLVGSLTDQVLNVQKLGSQPATNVSAQAFSNSAFQFKGGSYPGAGGTCGATITANCTLVVSFHPAAVSAYSDSVRLSYNSGSRATEASGFILGQGGTNATVTITPGSSSDFGTITINSAIDKNFIISTGDSGVIAIGVAAGGATPPFQLLNQCPDTMAAGQTCTVTVRFRPTLEGVVNGNFSVTYFDGAEVKTVNQALKGSGDSGALIKFSQDSVDFGGVTLGMSQIMEIHLDYYGVMSGGNCVFTGISDGTSGSGSGSGNGGPFQFPGGSFPGGGTCQQQINSPCVIRVEFFPRETRTYSTVITMQYDDGTGNIKTTTIELKGRGQGTAPAVLEANANPVNFGDVVVNSKTTQTITITRTGDLSATEMMAEQLSEPFQFEGGAYPGTGGTCGETLTEESCTLVVSYEPREAGETFPEILTLYYFDGAAMQDVSVVLTGSAHEAAYLVASDIDFGRVPLSMSGQKNLTLKNVGTRAATAVTFIPPGSTGAFSLLSSTCLDELAPGATCTMSFDFTPLRPGYQSIPLWWSYESGTDVPYLGAVVAGSGTVPVLVQANGDHSCARLEDGSLRCWGHNNYGQLGLGDTTNRMDTSLLVPVRLGAGRYVRSVAVGYWHTCAILDDESLKCWGYNNYGQLGTGSSIAQIGSVAGQMGDSLAPVDLGAGVKVKSVAAGYAHTCAVLEGGIVKCWGYNGEGQLGLGDIQDRGRSAATMGEDLLQVELGGRATAVTASAGHTCALLESGDVKCWGNNFYGQLGLEDFVNRGNQASQMGSSLLAVDLGAGRTARKITAGGAFTCALLDNDKVKCWGRNDAGTLGRLWCEDTDGILGDCSDSRYVNPVRGYGFAEGQMGDALPYVELGSRRIVDLSSANSHTCAILDDATVKCWGGNEYGQLGLGSDQPMGVLPEQMGEALSPVNLGSGAEMLSSGGSHSCAVLTSGQIKCWGSNRFGELGLGDTRNRGVLSSDMGQFLPGLGF